MMAAIRHSFCLGSRNLQEEEVMGITEYVLLGLVAVTGVYLVTIYNNLVRLKHTVTRTGRTSTYC